LEFNEFTFLNNIMLKPIVLFHLNILTFAWYGHLKTNGSALDCDLLVGRLPCLNTVFKFQPIV